MNEQNQTRNPMPRQQITRQENRKIFTPSRKEFKRTQTVSVPQPTRVSPVPTAPVKEAPVAVSSEWKDLKEQAVYAFESGLLPRSIDTSQKAVTIALMGREVGLSPLQALCGIYVVNGMAMLKGSLMLRLIYERVPGAQLNVLTPPEKANLECEVEMKRPGGKAHIFRYSVEDAKKAGFMQKPIWQLHTSTMLRWAAIRTGARIIFADAIAGCYMEDEVPAEMIDEVKLPVAPVEAKKVETEVESLLPAAPAIERVRVSDLPVASAPSHKPVTEKQVNRLFGIAHGSHWSRHQVAELLHLWFKKADPHQLTRIEYDKICNFILETPGPAESIETLLERKKAS